MHAHTDTYRLQTYLCQRPHPPPPKKKHTTQTTQHNNPQVKFLKFLQLYPPPADANQADRLTESLRKILTHTAVSETVNKSNADHAVLFEAVNLVLSHGAAAQPALRNQALTLLGRFIAVKEPNIRYLGLEALGRFAQLEQLGEGGLEGIKKHQATVFVSLKVGTLTSSSVCLAVLATTRPYLPTYPPTS